MHLRPDLHCYIWNDVVQTGVNTVQLRSCLTRGVIKLGLRRNAKLTFYSFRDLFTVGVLRQLDLLRVPIRDACRIAVRAGRNLEAVRDFVASDHGTDFALILRLVEGELIAEYQRVDGRLPARCAPQAGDAFIRMSLWAVYESVLPIAEAGAAALEGKAQLKSVNSAINAGAGA